MPVILQNKWHENFEFPGFNWKLYDFTTVESKTPIVSNPIYNNAQSSWFLRSQFPFLHISLGPFNTVWAWNEIFTTTFVYHAYFMSK
jgi:hypothetical protein